VKRPVHSQGSGSRQLRKLLVFCALCALMAGVSGAPLDVHPAEPVKAAFVLRFAGYVTWPEESLPPGKFTIAVLGGQELVPHLQGLLAGRSLLNRQVQVRKVASAREAADAQVLYVGGDHRGDLRALLAPLAGHNVLVVTDEDGGLAAGAAINLLLADQRVRFEISVEAARRARLKISSDLLALAVRVLE
jgi:hypothetical protein